MNKTLALTLISTLGLSLSCTSQGSSSATETATRVLEEQLTSRKTPGLQYAFFSADSVLFRHGGGWADLAGRVPVSEATTYNGFSITKTFTALAVLQLVERGKVELDGPAAAYVPDFPYSSAITVRHLLAHAAGLPNPIPLSWIHLQEEHAVFDRDAFFRGVFERHSKLKGSPNERFGYSNLGYVLLGQLIENVSGLSYEAYVTQRILEPIGLSPEELGFSIHDASRARGYHRRRSLSYWMLGFLLDKPKYMEPSVVDGWRSFRPYYVNGAAYGGLIGTAEGFTRYAQALLDPLTRLISEEYKEVLFTENVLEGGKPSGMALSWFRGELEGYVYFAHAGGGGGYYAEVRIYPALKRGSVILFNRSGMSDERFLDEVDRHLLRMERESAGS